MKLLSTSFLLVGANGRCSYTDGGCDDSGPLRRSPSTRTAQQWQFKVEDTVYEALYDPIRLGYWETKAYCDDLGGGWQLPTPTNYAENVAASKINSNIYLGIAQQRVEGGAINKKWYNIYTGKVISYREGAKKTF